MKKRILNLKTDIVYTMQIKFGKVIDINEIEEAIIRRTFQKSQVNELEEVMLKRLVFDMRMKSSDIKEIYDKELSIWQVSNYYPKFTSM